MLKKDLRLKYSKLRNDLSIAEIESLSLELTNELLQLPIWHHSFYHIFLSIEEKKEINTDYILNILSGKDKNIVIPKTNLKTNTLSHYLLTDNTLLKNNKWNIPEPLNGISISEDQIEVVFIPLLAFDLKGNRVGYGKGFYDDFLKKCSKDVLKIGLSFFEAEETITDVRQEDITLDYCVTPLKTYLF